MKKPTLESFLKDVSQHEMKVESNHGLYRTFYFGKPGTGNMHFRITQWPGYLTYSGDMGCYTFSRIEDMLHFFRSEPEDRGINPGYWEEKIQSLSRYGNGCSEFSREAFETYVNDTFNQWVEDLKEEELSDPEEIEERDEKIDSVKDAIDSLLSEEDEIGCIAAIRDWDEALCGDLFIDWWENDFEEYTYHYLWCCWALAWGCQLAHEEIERLDKEASAKTRSIAHRAIQWLKSGCTKR